MAGHSKWAGIKHKKAIVDARRGKLFTKLARAITVAAKEGGGDPDGNPALALAVQKAKDASMPKDNIERAIAKGTGEGADADALETVLYEGYGPGGVALLVEALTDNRNRTGSEIRHLFSKHGGNLGEPGSVAYLFDKRGRGRRRRRALVARTTCCPRSRPARSTSSVDDDVFEVLTEPADLAAVRAALEEAGVELESAEVVQYPKTRVPVDEEAARRVLRLIDALEDNDDVERGARELRRRRRGPRAGRGRAVTVSPRGPGPRGALPPALRRPGAVGRRRPDHAGRDRLRRPRPRHGHRPRPRPRRRRLPFALFAIAGGVVSDRVGRREVMIASDVVRALVAGTVAVLLLTGVAEVWMLVVLSALYGIGAAAFMPALIGLIPQTVRPDRLQEANALLALTRSIANVAGPALAGIVIARSGPARRSPSTPRRSR